MNKQYKLNLDLFGKKSGDIIDVETDDYGIPLDKKFREAWSYRDIDNCMEVVNQQKIKKKVKENDND